jgi:hypothetical protein
MSDDAKRTRTLRGPKLPLSTDRDWDIFDAAYVLHQSPSTVRNLERNGLLPSRPRITKRITFDPKVVLAFREGWRPRPGAPLP